MGTPNYGVDYETQYDFLQIGTITSAQAALAVTARDNASVVDLAAAKKVIWSPDQGTAAAILRFRVDGTEDDAPVIEMYAAKGADYYTRIATLTLAQGTQDWSGGHFVDEITLSNEAWAHGIRANSVTDEVGRVVFNTGGFDRFLFIASTLAVTTVHVDIARLDKQIDHGLEIHSAILVLADNMTVSDVVSAISDMHTDLEAGLTNLYGLLGVNNDLTDLSRLELDSINDGVSNTIVKLTNLYGLLGVNNDLTDLSRLELDSINDGISNAVVGLTNLYGLLGVNNDLTDLTRIAVGGVANAVTSGSDSIVTALSQHEAGIRSGVKSALFDQETGTRSGVKSVMTDNETGMRSGVKSVFTDNETGMRSGITSALSNAVSELIINDDLVEAGLRSGVKSVFIDNETGMRSGILSALDLHEAGVRSGVKSAVTSAIGALMDGENISDLVDAVDLVTVEVSTAVSNLKAAVEAHGDMGIISGPETVTVDSNTETLSEMGIALEAGIRRVTLIPEGSGIYWADGAAAFGTNPFPNAVTQIDCTKAQIITREFVCSDGVTKTMQVIQEG